MGSPRISYMAHLAGTGDTGWVSQPLQVGTTGEVRGMQSIMFRVDDGAFGVRGRCRLSDVGELDWVQEGKWIGQRAQGHHLELIALELTGSLASTHDLFYRVHFSGAGWTRTVSNGTELGQAGMRIEALEAFVLLK